MNTHSATFELAQDKPPAAKPPRQKRERDHPKAFKKKADFLSYIIPPAHPHETWFRHSHWKAKREKVRQAMISIGTGTFAMNRFEECGSQCVVEWSDTLQKHRIRGSFCHCRHCEPCMRAKANKLAANLRNRLEKRPNGRYRFITLTLKHSDTPLQEQIAKLYGAFKKLRTLKLWKKSQHGGAFMLEVKWQADTRRWHPHLHIISEGNFLEQKELSAAWLQCTGDSQIVDIRCLHNEKDAAHYLCKYVTKGTSSDVWNDYNAAQEWLTATKGLRGCATFGVWRGFKLMETTELANDWQPVKMLHAICQQAQEGSLADLYLLLKLRPPGCTEERPNTTGRTASG